MLAAEVHAQISMVTGAGIPTLVISHSGGFFLNLPWMFMNLQLISKSAEKVDVIDEVEGT